MRFRDLLLYPTLHVCFLLCSPHAPPSRLFPAAHQFFFAVNAGHLKSITMPPPSSPRPPLLLLLALSGAASSFLPLLANAFGGVVIVRPPITSRVAVLRATTDRLARRRSHHHPRSSPSSSRSSGGVSSTTTTTTSRTATANGVEYTTDRYDDLISWFLSSDTRSYVSPKIDIRPSTRGGLATGGYGTFARTDLEGGELLLRVPRSCCVTLDDALNDVECGMAFRKLMETAGPGAGE